jgi:hypothetical protein
MCAFSHRGSFPLHAIQRPGNIAAICGAYEPFGHVRKLLRDEEQDRRQKEELAQQLIQEEEAAKKAAEKKKKKKKKKGQVPYGRRTCIAAVYGPCGCSCSGVATVDQQLCVRVDNVSTVATQLHCRASVDSYPQLLHSCTAESPQDAHQVCKVLVYGNVLFTQVSDVHMSRAIFSCAIVYGVSRAPPARSCRVATTPRK